MSPDRSALIVGAGGLVGSALAKRLVRDDWSVTATIRTTESSTWAADALFGARVELADLLDAELIDEVFQRTTPRVVVDCAGLLTPVGPDAVRRLVDSNVTAPAVLLDACRRHGIDRVLLMGSGFEYAPASTALAEGDPIGPTNLYGVTKVAATAVADHYRVTHGMDICVIRPFSVFGPRERLHRFVPYVIGRALTGQAIEMSAGSQSRDYLFVDDLADGLAKVAGHDTRLPPVVNFSGGDVHSLAHVAERAVAIAGADVPIHFGVREANSVDRSTFLGDSSLARSVFDWQPSHDLEAGLDATVGWYRAHQDLWMEGVS